VYVYAFDPNAESVAEADAAIADEARDRVRFGVHDIDALDWSESASTSRCAAGRSDACPLRAS
jgi:hypothetical protein